MKVGDLVRGTPSAAVLNPCHETVGVIVSPLVTGLWRVLVDGMLLTLLERELEVVCEAG